MKADEYSKSQLIDQLRELKIICEAAIRVAESSQKIKKNRISALKNKRYEITSAYRKALKRLDAEIQFTQSSKDYCDTFPSRSSDQPG